MPGGKCFQSHQVFSFEGIIAIVHLQLNCYDTAAIALRTLLKNSHAATLAQKVLSSVLMRVIFTAQSIISVSWLILLLFQIGCLVATYLPIED